MSNSQAARAIQLLDALESQFAGDDEALDLIRAARAKGLTVLGRLLTAENMHRLGLQMIDGNLRFTVTARALRTTIMRILTDLGTPALNTRTRNSAPQIRDYLDSIQDTLPGQDDRVPEAVTAGDTEPATDDGSTTTAPSPTPPPQRTKHERIVKYPFRGLRLTHASPKTRKVLAEITRLPIDDHPHIVAASVRMLIDLYTADVWEALHPGQQIDSPSRRAKKCLNLIESLNTKSKDRKFPQVHNALAENLGDLSIDTMNGFMHRPNFHPTGDTIRVQVTYYEPFLNALDAEVTDRLSKL